MERKDYSQQNQATDLELLRAWREGDRRAGDRLFLRHFESIYRFFAGKVAGDAEDLVQATFLACVEGQDAFRHEASFRSYLFAVARRLLYRCWRTHSRAREVDLSVATLQDLSPTPSLVLRWGQEQRLLLEGLRRIPVELQLALELHYWEQFTGPELALVLGVPEGTARSRLRRAREALLEQLAQLTDSADLLASTTANLDRWASSLKELLGQSRAAHDLGDGLGSTSAGDSRTSPGQSARRSER